MTLAAKLVLATWLALQTIVATYWLAEPKDVLFKGIFFVGQGWTALLVGLAMWRGMDE